MISRERLEPVFALARGLNALTIHVDFKSPIARLTTGQLNAIECLAFELGLYS